MLSSQLPAGRLSGTNISRREGSLRAMFSAGTLVFALVSILVKQIPQSVCSPAILMYEPLISAVLPLVSEPLVLLFVVLKCSFGSLKLLKLAYRLKQQKFLRLPRSIFAPLFPEADRVPCQEQTKRGGISPNRENTAFIII